MAAAFAATAAVDVVEHSPGTGPADFWGTWFAFSGIDRQDLASDAWDRGLTLPRACWAFFDEVRARASAELQKGPRGGGRGRDRIVRHTVATERHWAKKIGVFTPQEAVPTGGGLKAHRDADGQAMRALHAQGQPARAWPLRSLMRRTAYHTMDHAWEMEDQDPTARRA
jgi:hypothetical protein